MKNNSESRNAPADHRGGNAPLPFEKNTKKPAGAWDPSLEAGANQKTSEYVDQQPDTADTTDMFSLLVEDQLGNSTEVPPDGKFHRFDDPEKRSGNRNCFAMLNEEGTYGVYGNWGTGEKYHWFGESNTEMSSDELAEIHQRIEATYQDRADQRAEDHDAAAEEARSLIAKSSNPRPDYPYLKRKNIGVANSRQYGERLLIPMENVDGELRNTQQIHPDGSKRFQKGGEVSGNFSLIGAQSLPTEGKIVVCEGWGTGVTLNQQHNVPVAAAMNAGNLLEVCRQLRDKLPDTVRIIVAADDDRNTQGNPGLAMAFLAAEHVGAEVIRPELPCSDCECTDFNDLTACPDAPKRDSGTGLDSTDQGPIPLQTTLPPVEPLVAAMLPESFVGFVTSTSEQMQAPIDYLAVSTMVTAAGAVGASVEIHPKQHDSWRVVPVLWGALIGPPSAMKSPCLSAATRAARDIEDDLREQHKTEMMLYDMDQELAEAKQKEAREKAKKLITTDREQARAILQASGGDIEEPVPQRLIINDATVEKVGEIMGQNPDGLLLIRDELSGFVAKLNDEDAQSARAFYLECFDGQNPFTYDRIGRGTIHIKRCVMSILGGIQPSKIAQIVERALHGQTDDGFLQRFQLPVWPDQPKNWKYVDIAGDDEAYQRYADVIRALHNIRHRDADSPALTLRFSEEAQVLFRHWYEHIQIRARGDDVHPVMQAFMLKLPKTIASFALLFELIDGGREHVGVPAIERALLWAPYLESHANRLYSAANTRAISGAKLILARRGKLPGIFTAREIIRNSWTGLTTKGAVTAALELLVDHRYLIVIPTPHSTTGGRPTTRYRWRESDSREG